MKVYVEAVIIDLLKIIYLNVSHKCLITEIG
jgi:hypothetical protein